MWYQTYHRRIDWLLDNSARRQKVDCLGQKGWQDTWALWLYGSPSVNCGIIISTLYTCEECTEKRKEVLRDFDLLWADKETMSWVCIPARYHALANTHEVRLWGKHCSPSALFPDEWLHRRPHPGLFAFQIQMSATSRYGRWLMHVSH